jgi:hypothetical protein
MSARGRDLEKPMFVRTLLMICACLLLTACLSTGPRERDAIALERYQTHAGEPVDNFYLRRTREWASLGESHVAVYTSVNEAWLLEVSQPCWGLEYARAISLTSSGSRVYARFDSVKFDDQICRIQEIRKVDVRAMKAQRRAESGRG